MNSLENEHIEERGNKTARLIMSGQWLYDGIVPKPVRIFALNFDFYYDLDEGYHDEGEKPELNSQGDQYVVAWHDEPFFCASSFPTMGYMRLADAKKYADGIVEKIDWQEPVTNKYV